MTDVALGTVFTYVTLVGKTWMGIVISRRDDITVVFWCNCDTLHPYRGRLLLDAYDTVLFDIRSKKDPRYDVIVS